MTVARLNSRYGIPLRYANRHGLITGQTGTGKSVSLMRLAEEFSRAGVPVFVSDVKGDLSALGRSCPVASLDLFGNLSVTVSAMGADLMARALELTDTQAACLEIAFAYALDKGAQLNTLDDLRAILASVESDPAAARFGRVTSASVGVVLRSILRLESQGAGRFFGAPCFDVAALLQQGRRPEIVDTMDGEPFIAPSAAQAGLVSILDSVRLINSPRVYSAFLLWLLSDLWERLPEIGDQDKPRLVFFFDEAHLLFQDCPAPLLRRIEQTARLIRSKGVGIYFVSQSLADVPELIKDQLAFRLVHSRDYRVGQAAFSGIDSSGRPFDAGVVKVDLPSCPLGPMERPEPAPADPAAAGRFDRAGYAFLLACACALAAAAPSLLAWLHASGKLGAAAAIGAGLLFAVKRKL